MGRDFRLHDSVVPVTDPSRASEARLCGSHPATAGASWAALSDKEKVEWEQRADELIKSLEKLYDSSKWVPDQLPSAILSQDIGSSAEAIDGMHSMDNEELAAQIINLDVMACASRMS